jgi:hypothetical protein
MMTFDGNLKQEELMAAQIVARRVELDRVDMIGGSFALKVQLEDLPNGLRIDHVNTSQRYTFSVEKNVLSVFVHYACNGNNLEVSKQAEQSAPAFEVDATFMLRYHLIVTPPPEDKRDEFFLGFAKVNGVFNSWPYLREFVQSSAARAGIGSVTLPVFRVPQLPQLPQPQAQPQLPLPPPTQSIEKAVKATSAHKQKRERSIS